MNRLLFGTIVLFCALRAQAQTPLTLSRPYTKDDDANFSYAIYNDDHSLVVALKVQDPAEALKLARNGMEVWIDPKGKKNKKIGVHYPLGLLADSSSPRRGGGMADWSPGDTGVVFLRKQAVLTLLRKPTVEYTGFKPEVSGRKDVSDTSVFMIVTAYPFRDAFYYSVRIPFSAFREPVDPHHPFSVGIIIKGMPMGGGPDGGGGPPGDDGGGFGGGPPPGGGPGGSRDDDFRRLFADDVVWKKVELK